MSVDNAEVRAHLVRLRDAGMTWQAIRRQTRLASNTLYSIMNDRHPTVLDRTAEAILDVVVPAWPPLPAALGATRRLQALIAAGHPLGDLARALGRNPLDTELLALVEGVHVVIDQALHDDVCRLFDGLQMQPGHNIAAARLGADRRWPRPLDWDEDKLDDPEYQATRTVKPPTPAELGRGMAPEDRELRRVRVRSLTLAGFSAPKIAAILGITPRLVQRDRAVTMTSSPSRRPA